MQTNKLFTARTRHAHCNADVQVGRLFGAIVHISDRNVSVCQRSSDGTWAAIVWQRYGAEVVRTAVVRKGKTVLLHEVKKYVAS